MALSIEAKWIDSGWEAYFDNGREHSGLDVVNWAKEAESRGAGEIVLTSVDREGTGKGFDVNLVKAVTDVVNIPVIASGGMGKLVDINEVALNANADGIAMAHALHYGHLTVAEVRDYCLGQNISVRKVIL